MSMVLDWARLAAGALLLYLGAEWFVAGASALAIAVRIPQIVIGLTVVAYGTSAPEVIVGIEAAVVGHGTVALGNVIGSNIANIGLILGATALVSPIAVAPSLRRRELPVLTLSTVLVFLLLLDGSVARWEGAGLLVLSCLYTAWMIRSARRASAARGVHAVAELPDPVVHFAGSGKRASLARVSVKAALGLSVLLFGGSWFIAGAVAVARNLGMSERVVGLTIVAIGTSLPELATSVIAALRRHGDVALGNVVGSNIFNLLGILGATALFRPIPVPAQIAQFDNWVMLAATVLFIVFAATKATLERWEGGVLLAAYAAYVALLLAPSIVAGGGFALAPA
jgi:cation:H+ antiporter